MSNSLKKIRLHIARLLVHWGWRVVPLEFQHYYSTDDMEDEIQYALDQLGEPDAPEPLKPEPFTIDITRAGQYKYVLINTDDPGYVGSKDGIFAVSGDSVTFHHKESPPLANGETLQIAYTVEFEDGPRSGVYEFDHKGKLL